MKHLDIQRFSLSDVLETLPLFCIKLVFVLVNCVVISSFIILTGDTLLKRKNKFGVL